MKSVKQFCEKAGITLGQFHGNEPINGDLDLDWAEELPDGFSPVVNGNLWLDGLKKIPHGFDPVVNWDLSLDGLKLLRDGFNPMVGDSLFLNGLEYIPEGFNPTVGGSVYLDGLESIPEYFDPMVGNRVIFNDGKSSEFGFSKPPAILEWQDGKYFSIDWIFMKNVSRRDKAIEGRTLDGETLWVYGEGDTFTYGETLEGAREDYEFEKALDT